MLFDSGEYEDEKKLWEMVVVDRCCPHVVFCESLNEIIYCIVSHCVF